VRFGERRGIAFSRSATWVVCSALPIILVPGQEFFIQVDVVAMFAYDRLAKKSEGNNRHRKHQGIILREGSTDRCAANVIRDLSRDIQVGLLNHGV
jgi:hypothetical protein